MCRFEGEGESRIGKDKKQGLRFDSAKQRMHINSTQFFAPLPEDVWAYRVGGYQVCEKWLKDRRGRRLDLDDIRTYCRVVTALTRTISIQEEIDAVYSQVEDKTIPLVEHSESA